MVCLLFPKTLTVASAAGRRCVSMDGIPATIRIAPEKAHHSSNFVDRARCVPEKAHLKSGTVPVYAHFGVFRGPVALEKWWARPPRKSSPSKKRSSLHRPPWVRCCHPADPVYAHVESALRLTPFPNPLTTYPATAHGHPRISSRRPPARAHDSPCKSSR